MTKIKLRATPIPKQRGVAVTEYAQMCELNLPPTITAPLWKALKRARASDSATEAQFVGWLVSHVSQFGKLSMIDPAGNAWLKIPKADGTDSETLFVAHTDTVHFKGGANPFEILGDTLQAGLGAECLGADNGAGLSLLAHMMANKVPGTYVFSRGEEIGGVGAKYMADYFPELLGKHSRAVTFDRRGTADVISHQGGERCCSDTFAWALADALNDRGMLYAPCEKGVYTDTKEFTGDIAECTNVSTGYFCEHGSNESLDLEHYRTLAAAVITIDWEALPTERDTRSGLKSRLYGSSIFDDIEAAFDGEPAALKQRLAEALYPDDPVLGGRYINMSKLAINDYEEALGMYEDTALDYLLDCATNSDPVL